MRSYIAVEKAGASSLTLKDAFILFKPGIVGLVLVSTLTGIFLAGGSAKSGLIIWTLLGIGLATAGSAALNNYFDRDIDSLMERTNKRALVTGSISPGYALAIGLGFVMLSIVVLTLGANPLTATLSTAAVFIYVVLYAMVLKRRSSWANQVGGLAGALPPVIGFAAVTGTVGAEALILFLLVGVWQQPHALSLALKYRDDYAKANVPVVPVAKGVKATKLRIALYALLLLPVSVLPYLVGMTGVTYLFVAIASGLVFLGLSLRFFFSKRESDISLFFSSIVYLTVVFLAMVMNVGF